MSHLVPGKIFESDGLYWNVEQSDFARDHFRDWIAHALCSTKRCGIKLDFTNTQEVTCFQCKRKYVLSKPYEALRAEVDLKYQASKNWDAEVINLDLLPTKVSSEDKDENYKIIAKLGQKNGKRTAIVYIVDRQEHKGEKAQFFIDVDDEMVRFDKDDKHPMQLLAKIEAEFLESKHEFTNKNEIKSRTGNSKNQKTSK